MRLRNRQAPGASKNEAFVPVTRSSRVSQAAYLSVILGIVLYIAYYAVHRRLYFEVVGHVDIDRVAVETMRGGRVLKLNHGIDDRVVAGAVLAEITPAEICAHTEPYEQLQLSAALDVQRSRAAIIETKMLRKRAELQRLDRRSALELDRHLAGRQRKLGDEIHELEADITLIQLKIDGLSSQLAFQSEQRTHPRCRPEEILAPTAGRVRSISVNPYQVVPPGQALFAIHPTDSRARIVAYLDYEFMDEVRQGQQVDIQFPGDRHDMGYVQSIDSSAQAFPDRIWNGYEPVETKARLLVVPLNEQDQSWHRYDRMQVKIKGNR